MTRRLWVALPVFGIALTARALPAQEMDVPVSIQIPLFLKVLGFDRQQVLHTEEDLVIAIAFQSDARASRTTKDEVVQLLRQMNAGPDGRAIRIVPIDMDHEQLADALAKQHVHILYITPVRGLDVGEVARLATARRVITMTGVPAWVSRGIAVGTRLQGERPKLLINLTAARAAGADFTSELLKLAQVFP